MAYVLYRHFDQQGRLLYVGRTNNPPDRFAAHRANKDNPWWMEVRNTTQQVVDTIEELKAVEREAIRTENPVWNVQYNRNPPERQRRPRVAREFSYRADISWKISALSLDIELVHPSNPMFSFPRARKWATANRYFELQVNGPARCAHALYLADCPVRCKSSELFSKCVPNGDHMSVWVPDPRFIEMRCDGCAPFVLSQPYRATPPESAKEYAALFGLEWYSDGPYDWLTNGWHHPHKGIYPDRWIPVHDICPLEKFILNKGERWLERITWPEVEHCPDCHPVLHQLASGHARKYDEQAEMHPCECKE